MQRTAQHIRVRSGVDWHRTRQQSAVNRRRRSEHGLEQCCVCRAITVVGVANTQVVRIGMGRARDFPGSNHVCIGLARTNKVESLAQHVGFRKELQNGNVEVCADALIGRHLHIDLERSTCIATTVFGPIAFTYVVSRNADCDSPIEITRCGWSPPKSTSFANHAAAPVCVYMS